METLNSIIKVCGSAIVAGLFGVVMWYLQKQEKAGKIMDEETKKRLEMIQANTERLKMQSQPKRKLQSNPIRMVNGIAMGIWCSGTAKHIAVPLQKAWFVFGLRMLTLLTGL